MMDPGQQDPEYIMKTNDPYKLTSPSVLPETELASNPREGEISFGNNDTIKNTALIVHMFPNKLHSFLFLDAIASLQFSMLVRWSVTSLDFDNLMSCHSHF